MCVYNKIKACLHFMLYGISERGLKGEGRVCRSLLSLLLD